MNNPSSARSVPDLKAPRRFVDDYLPALLAQASHLISAEFHKVARQHGFSVSEWRVMASLAGGKALSIGELAQVAVMKQPTVTRMLDRMAAQGHVERMPHDSDRRITLVRITEDGERTVQQLMDLATEHERRVLEPFGLKSAEALKNTLRRMIELHEGTPPDMTDEDDLEEPSAGAPQRAASRKSSTTRAKASGS
ncbi:MAG: MarR family transcriptional regulator [Comamonadaceae bacterium]|nr:MAG: MarR family transcriptional regulator [Comamonadaceae bacterium]